MKPERIHVLGASGSGTTTLGKALASELGSTFLDTDEFFWLPTEPPFQEVRDRPERQRLLGAALDDADRWVLSGSLCGWGDGFISRFTRVVFLCVPTEVRIERLRRRELQRFGAQRIGPGGDMHRQHAEFMEWASGYDDGGMDMRSRRRHEEWLRNLPCPVLRLEGEYPVAELCLRVMSWLAT